MRARSKTFTAAFLMSLAVVSVSACSGGSDSGPTETPTPTATFLVEQDGNLNVDGVSVQQMRAVCTDSSGPRSCRFEPPEQTPEVTVEAGDSLKVTADVSTQFSLSVFNIASPTVPVTGFTVSQGKLQVSEDTPAGLYQVTVTGATGQSDALAGPTGGTWMMNVLVDKPAK